MAKKASNPGTVSAELGKQIAHAMIDCGIATNTELAQLTGLSKQTIGRILNGTTAVNVEQYTIIVNALGLSFIDLMVATDEALRAREED